MHNVILFDSNCIFCNRSVHFIMNKDPRGIFRFAALQSEVGQQLLQENNIPIDTDSFIVITEETWHEKSSAVLAVTKELHSFFMFFYVLNVLPRPLLDTIYTFIAKHRYQWFKNKESCDLLTSEERNRFLT